MKITIIAVGKLKEEYLRKGVAEYAKRLSRYCKLELIEVADEATDGGLSGLLAKQIKSKEALRIQSHLQAGAYVVALEIDGKQLSSEELAMKVETLATGGKSHLVFILGGSLGLGSEITQIADFSLSFSSLTFPHQLMRLILLEQIYRAFKIIRKEPYHK